MSACNLQSLLAQACANNFITVAQTDAVAARALKLQLLCNIVNGGGGSSAPSSINYPGPPALNPPALQNIVVDSNGVQWTYYGAAWHQVAVGFNPTTRTKIFGGSTLYDFSSGDYVYSNSGTTLVELEYSFIDNNNGSIVVIAITGQDNVSVSIPTGNTTPLSSFFLFPGDSATFHLNIGTGLISTLWEIK